MCMKQKVPNVRFPRDTSQENYQFRNFLQIDLKLPETCFFSPKNWLERQKERSERNVYLTKSS